MKRKVVIIVSVLLALVLAVSLVGCIPQGDPGTTGSQGSQGIQGIQGQQGPKGNTGAQGKQGRQGEQGEEGEEGEQGERGKRGYEGDEGERGYPGAKGATGSKGDTGEAGPPSVFLILVPKDSTDNWLIVTNEAVGCLLYEVTGPEFAYCFWATGLASNTDYSLIYYADTVDRYVDWGGNNPGALVATFVTNSGGNIGTTCGSVELGMSLPHPDDANGYYYNYRLAPDYYTHPFGAKLWLVPSEYYDDEEYRITEWVPAEFLFETDLIYYIDTDL